MSVLMEAGVHVVSEEVAEASLIVSVGTSMHYPISNQPLPSQRRSPHLREGLAHQLHQALLPGLEPLQSRHSLPINRHANATADVPAPPRARPSALLRLRLPYPLQVLLLLRQRRLELAVLLVLRPPFRRELVLGRCEERRREVLCACKSVAFVSFESSSPRY